MGLTVAGWQIAEPRVQGMTLRPMVGGFELVFGLRVEIRGSGNAVGRASVAGARITVRPDGGEAQALGFARPERPFDITSASDAVTASHDLHLHLQPSHVAALEALRGTGDLSFEFEATGTGSHGNGEQPLLGDWRHRVSRSDWIAQLRSAGARDVLLLEVPVPLNGGGKGWRSMAEALQRAEEQYRSGDYHGCIGSCRTAMEELGIRRHGGKGWAGKALAPLVPRSTREEMDKAAREAALHATLRHYTHLAHHGPSQGGAPTFTRAEAQLVLSLTAAAAAHAQAG